MVTGDIECAANFVFYDSSSVYLGQAAQCSRPSGVWLYGSSCASDSLPLGTKVTIEGASRPGTLVYNSWLTMNRVGEQSAGACRGNDFALVRLDNADEAKVNPSVPFWGGPTDSGGRTSTGERVYSYGHAETFDGNVGSLTGVSALWPKLGINTTTTLYPNVPWGGLRPGMTNGGWTHHMNTAMPEISGEGGGAVLDARGRAVGIVSWWYWDVANGFTDLPKAMAYMKAKTSLDAIQLAKGTTPFAPQLPDLPTAP